MQRKIKITYLEEVSSHDGYCSDDECEYTSRTLEHYTDIPEELKDRKNGLVADWEQYQWKLNKPRNFNDGGSCYCGISEEAMKHSMNRHEYRQTIISVSIVTYRN